MGLTSHPSCLYDAFFKSCLFFFDDKSDDDFFDYEYDDDGSGFGLSFTCSFSFSENSVGCFSELYLFSRVNGIFSVSRVI